MTGFKMFDPKMPLLGSEWTHSGSGVPLLAFSVLRPTIYVSRSSVSILLPSGIHRWSTKEEEGQPRGCPSSLACICHGEPLLSRRLIQRESDLDEIVVRRTNARIVSRPDFNHHLCRCIGSALIGDFCSGYRDAWITLGIKDMINSASSSSRGGASRVRRITFCNAFAHR